MHTHHSKRATLAQSDPTGPTATAPTAVASGDKDSNAQLVSAEVIRLCAYRKWESAGKPSVDGIQFWLEAEQELVSKKAPAAGDEAAHEHRQVTDSPDRALKEKAKKHTTSAHDHSQDADRHSKTRHTHSQKK